MNAFDVTPLIDLFSTFSQTLSHKVLRNTEIKINQTEKYLIGENVGMFSFL